MKVKKSDRTSKKRRYTSPGGDRRIEYHKRKHSVIVCASCGEKLKGVPLRLNKKSKTEKVPNRPYAGIYCSACSRKVIKDKIYEKIRKMGE